MGIDRPLCNGTATVNRFLNRASPWLDIDSYLPYEGKVLIRNKSDRCFRVLIPNWVSEQSVQARISQHSVQLSWRGRYLCFDLLTAGDKIQIEFPIREQIEEHKFLDKVDGETVSVTYKCVFRGNTLVSISPRTVGPGYRLYERSHLRNSPAVCHNIPHFSV